jgi:hypothetical protein
MTWVVAALAALPASATGSPYSVAFGGGDLDLVRASEVDAAGNSYFIGETLSADFPTTHPPIGNPQPGGWNAFVVKLAADGSEVLYSILLGGSGDDYAMGVALDTDGYHYVVGSTTSADFPVTAGAADTVCGSDGHCNWGYLDAYALKLDPAANQLVYSTFLGGGDRDEAYHVTLDGYRRAHIVGATASPDFPVAEAFQPALNPGAPYGIPWDGFVTRLSAAGTRFQVSTYIGGGGEDFLYDARFLSTGMLAVVGATGSTDFPITDQAVQEEHGGGSWDGLLTVFSASLRRVEGATYIGGTKVDIAVGVAADAQDRVFVVGTTKSVDFPVLEGIKSKLAGSSDAFVTAFLPAGLVTSRQFSTYYGGTSDETGVDVEVSADQSIVFTGITYSASLPGVGQDLSGDGGDTYVAMLESGGQAVSGFAFATDLDDLPADLDLGADGSISLAGCLETPSGPEGADAETTADMEPGDGFAARVAPPSAAAR